MMDITRRANDLADLLLALLKVAGLAVALLVLIYAVWRVWQLRRRFGLVVEDFVPGSAPTEAGTTTGISNLAREGLVDQLTLVRARIDAKIAEAGLKEYSPNLDRFPLAGVPDRDTLADQVASLAAIIPEIGPLASALGTVGFRLQGDKVSGVLQHISGKPDDQIGLTLLVTDLRGVLQPRIFTIWRRLTSDTVADRSTPGNGKGATEDQKRSSLHSVAMDEYVKLLNPAMRLLALEVARRSILQRWQSRPWLARVPRPGKSQDPRDQQIKGRIHNFFGLLYQGSAGTFQPHRGQFLDLAINQFTEAKSLSPDTYQPFENLAETYLMKIARRAETDRKLVEAAQRNFTAALRLTSELPSVERQTAQRRIIVGQAIAGLLSDGPQGLEEAQHQIHELEALGLVPREEKDALTLYQLACFYGLALIKEVLPPKEARAKARLHLAYCLGRSSDFWISATQDEDLELIQDGLAQLERELEERLLRTPDLPTLDGTQFASILNEVMAAASWGYGPHEEPVAKGVIHVTSKRKWRGGR